MPLSILRGGKPPAILIANPVFFTSRTDNLKNGAEITFEILKRDAEYLHELVGKNEYYILDENTHFFGRLKSLESCGGAHANVVSLTGRAALRGTLIAFTDHARAQ